MYPVGSRNLHAHRRQNGNQTVMRSVPPHQRAEKAIHDLLRQGISDETAPDAPPEGSVPRLLMRLGLEAC